MISYSGVETVGWGPLPPVFAEGEPGPLQTLEGYNIIIIIIISLNTKAVIQLHKKPLHKYHLYVASQLNDNERFLLD